MANMLTDSGLVDQKWEIGKINARKCVSPSGGRGNDLFTKSVNSANVKTLSTGERGGGWWEGKGKRCCSENKVKGLGAGKTKKVISYSWGGPSLKRASKNSRGRGRCAHDWCALDQDFSGSLGN